MPVNAFRNNLICEICRDESEDVTYELVHGTTVCTDDDECHGAWLSHYLGRDNNHGTIQLVKHMFVPKDICHHVARPYKRRKWSDKDLEQDLDEPPTPPCNRRHW